MVDEDDEPATWGMLDESDAEDSDDDGVKFVLDSSLNLAPHLDGAGFDDAESLATMATCVSQATILAAGVPLSDADTGAAASAMYQSIPPAPTATAALSTTNSTNQATDDATTTSKDAPPAVSTATERQTGSLSSNE